MKTTKEDRDAIRLDADKAEESSIDWIRERGLRFRRVLSDLSRLAAIEGARAKGGLTETRRDNLRMLLEPTPLLQTERNEDFRTMLRLDDALRAANEELGRVREILQRGQSDLCDCGFCKEARAYLAEVEASDGK